METKASYVIVGIAALLGVALFFGMLLFAVNRDDGQKVTYYRIVFDGGVSGLSVGNDVRFNGIKVGEVRQIDIDQDSPSLVRVIVAINGNVPIRENSEAKLEPQGITGLSIVYITGGTAESPKLAPKTQNDIAEIKSTRSAIGMVIDNAPNLMDTANELLHRGVAILSPENEKNLKETLASLAVASDNMEALSEELRGAMRNITGASGHIADVLTNANKLFKDDFPKALHTFQSTFQRLDAILAKAEPGMDRLSVGVVDELQRAVTEATMALRGMNQLIQRINSDPQRFFYGDNLPSYPIK